MKVLKLTDPLVFLSSLVAVEMVDLDGFGGPLFRASWACGSVAVVGSEDGGGRANVIEQGDGKQCRSGRPAGEVDSVEVVEDL